MGFIGQISHFLMLALVFGLLSGTTVFWLAGIGLSFLLRNDREISNMKLSHISPPPGHVLFFLAQCILPKKQYS